MNIKEFIETARGKDEIVSATLTSGDIIDRITGVAYYDEGIHVISEKGKYLLLNDDIARIKSRRVLSSDEI